MSMPIKPTNWTETSINATNWENDDPVVDIFLFENGDAFLFENGDVYMW